jgi:hypothetical protein
MIFDFDGLVFQVPDFVAIRRHRPVCWMDDSETALGISAYLGSHEGFSAVSKARYSDFVVHESTFCLTLTDDRAPCR